MFDSEASEQYAKHPSLVNRTFCVGSGSKLPGVSVKLDINDGMSADKKRMYWKKSNQLKRCFTGFTGVKTLGGMGMYMDIINRNADYAIMGAQPWFLKP